MHSSIANKMGWGDQLFKANIVNYVYIDLVYISGFTWTGLHVYIEKFDSKIDLAYFKINSKNKEIKREKRTEIL